MSESQFNLLAKRSFVPLFLTQFLGTCNDHMMVEAVLAFGIYTLVMDISVGNGTLSFLVTVICLLPFLIFSGHAGILADKYEKSRIIRALKALEILIVILAGIAFIFNNLWLLLAVLFLIAAKAAYFLPVKHGILPELLEVQELVGGNAFIAMGSFISVFAGITIGFLLMHSVTNFTMVMAIMLGAAIIGWVISCRITKGVSLAAALKTNYNFWRANFTVVKISAQHDLIFLVIICIAWFWGIGFVYLLELPIYCAKTLHCDTEIMLLLAAALASGVALGGLICNKILDSKIKLTFVPLSLIIMIIFSMDLYFSSLAFMHHNTHVIYKVKDFVLLPGGLRILGDLFLYGFGAGIFIVPMYATLQHKSNPEQRGRNVAASGLINTCCIIIFITIALVNRKIGIQQVDILWLPPITGLILLIYFKHTYTRILSHESK